MTADNDPLSIRDRAIHTVESALDRAIEHGRPVRLLGEDIDGERIIDGDLVEVAFVSITLDETHLVLEALRTRPHCGAWDQVMDHEHRIRDLEDRRGVACAHRRIAATVVTTFPSQFQCLDCGAYITAEPDVSPPPLGVIDTGKTPETVPVRFPVTEAARAADRAAMIANGYTGPQPSEPAPVAVCDHRDVDPRTQRCLACHEPIWMPR